MHTLDAARLYRLAVEAAPAGSRLHAVAEKGVAFRQIAEAVGRHLDVPAVSVSPDDAAGYFDYLAFAVPLDNPTSSALTQELLGWQPLQLGRIADLDQEHYFQTESKQGIDGLFSHNKGAALDFAGSAGCCNRR